MSSDHFFVKIIALPKSRPKHPWLRFKLTQLHPDRQELFRDLPKEIRPGLVSHEHYSSINCLIARSLADGGRPNGIIDEYGEENLWYNDDPRLHFDFIRDIKFTELDEIFLPDLIRADNKEIESARERFCLHPAFLESLAHIRNFHALSEQERVQYTQDHFLEDDDVEIFTGYMTATKQDMHFWRRSALFEVELLDTRKVAHLIENQEYATTSYGN